MTREPAAGFADETHPGFTVTCKQCGSTDVYVENSVGHSHASGSWGSVDLTCSACPNIVAIYEAY